MNDQFVRVRLVRMNQAKIDLNLFEFDYDLTWAGFFINQHGHVYARYGSRKERDADTMISEKGLITVMKKVLKAHKTDKNRKPPRRQPPKLPESYRTLPAKFKNGQSCMHCHQVYDYERRDLGTFDRREALRVYPIAENLGFSLSVDEGNVVTSVEKGGFADKAGLRVKDEVVQADKTPVYSSGDLSWVLHNLKKGASVSLKVKRGGGTPKTIRIKPTGDWRSRDMYWRGSMWAIRPMPGFGGKVLTDAELSQVGLRAGSWAFKVRYIATWGGDAHASGTAAKAAGLKNGDIVYSVAGRTDFDSELEFQAWYRLNMKSGSMIKVGIIRGGKRQTLNLKVT